MSSHDQGSYLLILRLARDRRLAVGALGSIRMRRGHYVYVGSAMRNLSGRVARHGRRRKTLHWHIDHLSHAAQSIVPLCLPSTQRLECDLAAAVSAVLQPGPHGFGASDCHCPTHLFCSTGNPLEIGAFCDVLQRFGWRPPPAELEHANRDEESDLRQQGRGAVKRGDRGKT